ncbi:autotransporter domain-containing protein [Pseudomonas sp. 6D_7.1_Bac1]|uniref:autotransporter outer membrane beta-barrel domain-containing protein n=1 Tax=Pseudomonas sp. 6D_7.1_Bac1 TaxID=2971615 RepID=UPI0021C8A928|nr:autotransporter domain-containing protein [Pseudomonas sp. 6D_7.1_Bac1]MCU1748094.1 autotransporter domain-containing protein [Pseudomonas sp. 6D_7.1_Bac1]
MLILHTHRPHHLALAIALAFGGIDMSHAQQTEPAVTETKPSPVKARKPAKPKPDAQNSARQPISDVLATTAVESITADNRQALPVPDPLPVDTMYDTNEPTASEGLSAALTSELPAELATNALDVSLESAATTDNARQVANSLETDKPGTTQTPKADANNAAINALLTSDTENAAIALEQLAGVSNANLATATLSSARPVSASMLSTMRELSDDASLLDRSATGHETNGRVWVQALGNSATLDDKLDDSALRQRTHGVVVGADWSLDSEWRVGLLGGKSQTRLDGVLLDGDLDSWHLGAYALRQSGPLALRLGATYSSHSGTTKRNVAFSRYSDRLKGSYNASSQQVFAELGYNLGSGAFQVEPFANLGHEHYQRDSYREKGGAAALKVDEQTQRNFNSIFGLRLAHRSDLENGMSLTPRMSAGWKHTYGDVSSHVRQFFLAGSESFYVEGIALDRNSLTLEAGLDLAVSKQHFLSVAYNGEKGSNSRDNSVMGQWRMSF